MLMFGKRLDLLEWDDIYDLLTQRAVENIRLEFKREVPAKDELLKKLSSFGNTFGGYAVIGADADSTGRLIHLPGVALQPSYKQQIIQWCHDGCDPPLTVAVSDGIALPSDASRLVYVVQIPESELGPHFLNGRNGCYIRTDEFSQRFVPRLATQQELLQLLDRRRKIVSRRDELLKRARQRLHTAIHHHYVKFGKNENGIGARFFLAFMPRYPAQPIAELPRLLHLLTNEVIDWRGVGFPRHTPSRKVISQAESALVLGPASSFSLLESNIWGLQFYASEIERTEGDVLGIHLEHFLGQLVIFVEHACMMLEAIGMLSARIDVVIRLEGIRGKPLLRYNRNDPQVESQSELDDIASTTVETDAASILQAREKLLRELLRFVFYAMNWPTVAGSESQLDSMIALGRRYNAGQ